MSKALLIPALLFSLMLGCFPFFYTSEKDDAAYRQISESGAPAVSSEMVTYSQQKRENVSKEIWYRAKPPMCMHIESKLSELFFYQRSGRFEVIEQLSEVQAVIQEELFYSLPDGREAILQPNGKYLIKGGDPSLADSWVEEGTDLTPMQTLRLIDAVHACYNYNTQLFLAQNVELKTFKVKGHQPLLSFDGETPEMSGKAQSVELLLKEGEMHFAAKGFKATFSLQEKL